MTLTVSRLLQEKRKQFDLTLRHGATGLDKPIHTSELNRPGLAFAGFLGVYTHDRIQILGNTEIAYLSSLAAEDRRQRLEKALSSEYEIPCFIVTDAGAPPTELCEICDREGIPLLTTSRPTTRFWSNMTFYLEREFAPTATIHGVLMDIFGIGVLIQGSAGVGKSECGLELIERGHQLVADDVVVVKRLSKTLVVGTAVSDIQHHMEVRGLGIVDVELLFGAGSVREEKRISVVVRLERADCGFEVDRLGIDEKYTRILDVDVREFCIPLEPGRNAAILVEVAALQHRIHAKGRNPAQELNEKLIKQMERSRLV
ncbi:MAG: HPr(Ser) kinase/phosphatase [Sumerlaeia bacterium]